MNDRGPRLLSLPPSVATERSIPALEDARAYFDPDGTWIPGPRREPRAVARARQVFDEPVVHPPLADGGTVQRHDFRGVPIVTVQRGSVLEDAADDLSRALAAADRVALVCDDVTTTVRPTALETRLEYAAELAATVPDGGEGVVVLTGGLPAGYDETWHLERTGEVLGVGRSPESGDLGNAVSIRIRGIGSVEGRGDAGSIAALSFTSGGAIAVETLGADDFGLEALTGVGPKTAERFEREGIATREELLEAGLETLRSLPRIGRNRAERMLAHAEVFETGEPRRLTDESLPGENWSQPPLCLDIETDGLSPTIIWQIGIYDPATDDYRAFVEREDPTDPASVLEAFCDWLLGIHGNRALLTWNGWRFDYRHLGSFVATHVPYYADEWESIPKFDLYLWADGNDNALLPGRTNQLEVVAEALGYEDAGTGLDGAATAAAYQRFARTGEELDWGRHEAYCEDDCRALWHVYERLREAPRASGSAASVADGDPNRFETTTGSGPDRTRASGSERPGRGASDPVESEQTGLSDF